MDLSHIPKDEQESVKKKISEILANLIIKNNITDTNELNMCHTCGYPIFKCKCKDCNCIMHKKLTRERRIRNGVE